MRPLKRVTNSTGNPRHELSQFRAPEKERTRRIKEKEDASSRSYEIFNIYIIISTHTGRTTPNPYVIERGGIRAEANIRAKAEIKKEKRVNYL